MKIKGIKGMDKNMCCRGFQFEIGKEYKIETNGRPLELCSDTVFHYCKSLSQVHRFYDCRNQENRFFEIEVLGEEVTYGDNCGSNHIRIVREIVGEELAVLKGLNGTNTGLFNSGNRNSGDWNSGNRNSGNRNSGYWNSGDWNSGNENIGYGNSGNRNSGNENSGYMNSGYCNSGVANKCCFSNGVFCNEDDMDIRIFNKPSGMSLKDFYGSRYWEAMCGASFDLTEWICYTDEEKAADPEKLKTGGYLKVYTYEEAWAKWWAELSEEDRKTIQEIPNFDPEVFKDITGITV